jgi:hypothetical protein
VLGASVQREHGATRAVTEPQSEEPFVLVAQNVTLQPVRMDLPRVDDAFVGVAFEAVERQPRRGAEVGEGSFRRRRAEVLGGRRNR